MTLNPIIQYPVFNIKKIPTFSQNMSCFLEQNDDFSAFCHHKPFWLVAKWLQKHHIFLVREF